jgi:hypothetical protein
MMDSVFLMKDAALVFIFVAVALCAAAFGIAVQWRKARQAEVEAALKQEMIQRGMSADEITRVLQATALDPPEGKQTGPQPLRGPEPGQ